MEKERFDKASTIDKEIYELTNKRIRLTANACPENNLEIKVNQCYGDMGMTFTNNEKFDGDIACTMFWTMIRLIDERIKQLQEEFDKV